MERDRKGWSGTAVGVAAVMLVLLALRWRGSADAIPNAIGDQPTSWTAERDVHSVHRQPTIIRADAAVSPLDNDTAISPFQTPPFASPPDRNSLSGLLDGERTRTSYPSATLDFLPILPPHDQPQP